MKKLGIFDIDGTIFRSSLFLELVYGLVDNNIFAPSILKMVEKEYVLWANRRGSYDDYLSALWELFIRNIKGKKEKEVETVIEKVLAKHKDRVYRFTRKLIKDLKRENFFLLAISGSPVNVVSKFSKHTGFDNYFGTELEVKNGKFTGKLLNETSFSKKDIVLKKFIEESRESYDLKNSVGVGDSESDIKFLEIIGNPIAFNPSKELAKYAKKKNWKIVVERKDVIYEISDFKFKN